MAGGATGGRPIERPQKSAGEAEDFFEEVGWDERAAGPTVPFGVPGLETTLPLLLTAVSEKRLTIEDILRLCHKNPAKIFGIRYFDDSNHRSEIEVDLSESYIIQNKNLFTGCHKA